MRLGRHLPSVALVAALLLLPRPGHTNGGDLPPQILLEGFVKPAGDHLHLVVPRGAPAIWTWCGSTSGSTTRPPRRGATSSCSRTTTASFRHGAPRRSPFRRIAPSTAMPARRSTSLAGACR